MGVNFRFMRYRDLSWHKQYEAGGRETIDEQRCLSESSSSRWRSIGASLLGLRD
jgi:hypothetical protein